MRPQEARPPLLLASRLTLEEAPDVFGVVSELAESLRGSRGLHQLGSWVEEAILKERLVDAAKLSHLESVCRSR